MFDSFSNAIEVLDRRIREALERSIPEDEFSALATSLYRLQADHIPSVQRFSMMRGTEPSDLKDWRDIPAIPIRSFKDLALTSLPEEERGRCFFSSGTTSGNRSRHYHSDASMGLYETSLLAGYQWIQRRAERTFPSKLVSLTPEPSEVPHSSLAHMFGTWARGMEQVSFVGSIDEAGRWQVDVGRFIEAVQGEDVPALVVGTAFGFVHLLDGLDAEGLSVGLPEGSMILETGGYKGQSREIPKADLHRWIVESLGIHDRDIVNEYGMSELSSQAYSINGDPLVVPSWMRVELVSAETGRPIEDGGRGLIRVVDLANVRSVCSILTEDLGERRGDGFELHGRKLDAEPKGCSLLAV